MSDRIMSDRITSDKKAWQQPLALFHKSGGSSKYTSANVVICILIVKTSLGND